MPTTADFTDDTVLRETFMSFRSTPLPPSSHTAAEASSTVRRRPSTSTDQRRRVTPTVPATSASANRYPSAPLVDCI